MAGKKIHDNETKTHLLQCAKKEFMDKGFTIHDCIPIRSIAYDLSHAITARDLSEGGRDHRSAVFFLSGQRRSVL